ncbi:MAG: tetratricopeptide repeat protein [Cyclobacteriaceae bacterium]
MRYSYYLTILLLLQALWGCQTQEPDTDLKDQHLEAANAALKTNNIPTAVEQYELAAYYAPAAEVEKIRYNLAYAYYLASAPDEALAILTTLSPTAHNTWLRGLCYRYQEEHTKAIRAFEESISLTDPKDTEQLQYLSNWIGECLLSMGRYAEARSILEKNLQEATSDRNTYEALANLGLLYYEQADYAQARDYLRQALLYGSDAILTLKLAEACNKTGNTAQAADLIKEVKARKDLTIQDKMLVHVLQLALKGEDVSRLRSEIESYEPQAQMTRIHAQQAATIGELKVAALRAETRARSKEHSLWGVSTVLLVLAVILGVYLRLIRHTLSKVKRQKAALDEFMKATRKTLEAAQGLNDPLPD